MIGFNQDKTKFYAIYKNVVSIYTNDMKLEYTIKVSNDTNVCGCAFMKDNSILTLSEDKYLRHFNNNQLMHHLVFPKKLTSVVNNDDDIIVSDKFGDVYKVNINEMPGANDDANKMKDTLADHIVIAHFSLITSLSMSKKKNAIISTDRDEKVRITRYPRTDIIQSFGYGFVNFISSSKCDELDGMQFVVCGGADGDLRIFNLVDGSVIGTSEFGEKKVVIVLDSKVHDNQLYVLVSIENDSLQQIVFKKEESLLRE